MRKWFRSRRVREAELDEELQIHLEMETEKNRRAGMSEAEARAAAARAFGGVALVKDEVRDSWGARFWDSLKGDVKIGTRGLLRSRGFTAIVIVTLALGIGTNTAIFSIVDGVLLRQLPYGAGDRLVRLRQAAPAAKRDDVPFSALELADYRRARSFDGIAEYHSMHFDLIGHGEPRRVQTGVVSANFFDVLGVKPLLGRTFAAGEDAPGSQPLLMLSYGFWLRAFGGDPNIIGQQLEMNDKPHIVIGVLPPIPLYPDENDVFMPTSACPFRGSPQMANVRGHRMSLAFGRLADGATPERATSEVAAMAAGFVKDYPDDYADAQSMTANVVPVRTELTAGGRTRLLLLLAVSGFVLLIVCANVANLTLARGLRREHEMAVRSALGAARPRLLRQLLTEGLILSLAGGAVGLLAAVWAQGLLVDFAGRFSPRAQEIRIDGGVVLFTLLVSVATGLLFAAAPALPAGRDIAAALRDEGSRTGGSRTRGRLRASLVVAQIAFSVVLLVGAGLMLRSLLRLEAADPGFRAENVLTMRVDLDWTKYRGDPQQKRAIAMYDRILERVRALPGVTDAAVATTFPLAAATFSFSGQFEIDGMKPASPERRSIADLRIATPDYFKVMGIALLAGRAFDRGDVVDAPQVVMVNQSFVKHYLAGVEPIGRRISFDNGENWTTIAGVVADNKERSLDTAPPDVIFQPLAQQGTFAGSLLVRTAGDPGALARDVRQAIWSIDPRQPVSDLRTFNDVRAGALASPRLTTLLLGLFAILALVITAAGIGGVIALTVSQRTREIAVRMALGARRADVLSMILRQALELVAIGLAVGGLGAYALGHLMTSLLYDVAPTDPATYLGVIVLVIGVAVLACWAPARRAAGIDPMVALRAG